MGDTWDVKVADQLNLWPNLDLHISRLSPTSTSIGTPWLLDEHLDFLM